MSRCLPHHNFCAYQHIVNVILPNLHRNLGLHMPSCLLLPDRMHQNITAPNVCFLLWQIFSLLMTTSHTVMETPTRNFCLIYINHELNIMASWIAASDWCQGWIQPSKSEQKQTVCSLEIARKKEECSHGTSCYIKGRYWQQWVAYSLLAKNPQSLSYILYIFFNQSVVTNMLYI